MLNPVSLQVVGLPLLIVVSIPLASFALFTTALAAGLLLIRVQIVSVELGFALIRSWLVVDRPPQSPLTAPHSPLVGSTNRYKKRRTSASTSTSVQDVPMSLTMPLKSDELASLAGAAGLGRDFEGVGGWKLSRDSSDDALWIGLNSRLELPAVGGDRPRKHTRSLTSGSQRLYYSPEMVHMSPVQSGRTTPPAPEGTLSPEGYFSMQPSGRISTSLEASTKARIDERRRSLTGSAHPASAHTKSSKTVFSR